jgi:ABC-type amino acid transport substrate-binding protein
VKKCTAQDEVEHTVQPHVQHDSETMKRQMNAKDRCQSFTMGTLKRQFMQRGFRVMMSVLVVMSLSAISAAETLTIGGVEVPPWLMQDGDEVVGINVDIFREVATRTGYDMAYRVLPQKRMLVEFRAEQIDIDPATNPMWTSDDDKAISVFSMPFYESANVVFVRKDSGIRANTVQDFRGKTIGCHVGYYYTDGFAEAFASGTMTRDDANSHVSNVKKLNANRVDAVIVDQVTGLYLIKQLGLNPEDFEIAYVFEAKSALSMRIHKNKEHVLSNVNQALQDMKEDGTIQNIIDTYTK